MLKRKTSVCSLLLRFFRVICPKALWIPLEDIVDFIWQSILFVFPESDMREKRRNDPMLLHSMCTKERKKGYLKSTLAKANLFRRVTAMLLTVQMRSHAEAVSIIALAVLFYCNR